MHTHVRGNCQYGCRRIIPPSYPGRTSYVDRMYGEYQGRFPPPHKVYKHNHNTMADNQPKMSPRMRLRQIKPDWRRYLRNYVKILPPSDIIVDHVIVL